MTNATIQCKICNSRSSLFDCAELLGKYRVSYYRCERCGFIQTEDPYWLAEAYSAAIAAQDTGIMVRNLVNVEVTAAVLNLILPEARQAVDFGGGHGIFVRLMRDRGFDFYWCDRYASNDYARGFEHHPGHAASRKSYGLLTAFEVLEHLPDPMAQLKEIFDLGENVLVSTTLLPEPAPKISDWWYYVPATGQHVSFYTRAALDRIASNFGRRLLSRGQYHLFTKQRKAAPLFRLASAYRPARVVNRLKRRPSLVESDFQRLNE